MRASNPMPALSAVAILIILGLTAWQLPAWRSFVSSPHTAQGQITSRDMIHHGWRYQFPVDGRTYTGSTTRYTGHDDPLPYTPVHVFYAQPDPGISSLEIPTDSSMKQGLAWYFGMRFFWTAGVLLLMGRALNRVQSEQGHWR